MLLLGGEGKAKLSSGSRGGGLDKTLKFSSLCCMSALLNLGSRLGASFSFSLIVLLSTS